MAETDSGLPIAGDDEQPWSTERTQKEVLTVLRDQLKHQKGEKLADALESLEKILESQSKTGNKDSEKLARILRDTHHVIRERNNREKAREDDPRVAPSSTTATSSSRNNASSTTTNTVSPGFDPFESQKDANDDVVKSLIDIDRSLMKFKDSLFSVENVIRTTFIGGVLFKAFDMLTSVNESFQTLAQSGSSLTSSLFQVQESAARAGMGMNDFVKFLQENSQAAAAVGTQNLINVQRSVRESLKSVGMFGFQLQDVANFTASYLEQQVIAGRFERMSENQQRMETENYIRNLKELSIITGKRADELDKEINQNATNLDLQSALFSLSGVQRDRFENNITALNLGLANLPAGVQDAVREMIGSGQVLGNAFTSEFGGLVNTLPGLRSSFEGIQQAMLSGDPEAVERATKQFEDSLLNGGSEMQERLALFVKAGGPFATEAGQLIDTINTLRRQRDDAESHIVGTAAYEKRINEMARARQKREEETLIDQEINSKYRDRMDRIEQLEGQRRIDAEKQLRDQVRREVQNRVKSVDEHEKQLRREEEITKKMNNLETEFSELGARFRFFVLDSLLNSDLVNTILGRLRNAVNLLEGAFKSFADGGSLQQLLIDIGKAFMSVVSSEDLQPLWDSLRGLLVDGFKFILGALGSAISEILDVFGLGGIVGTVVAGLVLFSGTINNVMGIFGKLIGVSTSLAGGLGGLIKGIGALSGAKAAANMANSQLEFDFGDSDNKNKKSGGKGGKGGLGKMLGKAGALLGRVGGAVGGLAFGAYDAYDAYTDPTLSQAEKNKRYGGAAGGAGGALAGAAAGAALGSVVPIVGTAIGGLIGGALGYMGGNALGSSLFGNEDSDLPQEPTAQLKYLVSLAKDMQELDARKLGLLIPIIDRMQESLASMGNLDPLARLGRILDQISHIDWQALRGVASAVQMLGDGMTTMGSVGEMSMNNLASVGNTLRTTGLRNTDLERSGMMLGKELGQEIGTRLANNTDNLAITDPILTLNDTMVRIEQKLDMNNEILLAISHGTKRGVSEANATRRVMQRNSNIVA